MVKVNKDKVILDVCCGPRLFWFNKKHPNALYIDNRERNKGYNDYRKNREIKPDLIADFRSLPFPDGCFKLVIMDPPHLFSEGETFRMVKDYGYLNKKTWKEDIKKGVITGESSNLDRDTLLSIGYDREQVELILFLRRIELSTRHKVSEIPGIDRIILLEDSLVD